jgi:molybdate transport repressor ModE-like protein
VPLSPRLPDLSSLELLVDTAREGSIGAAARLHRISQQAASERLRAVEAQVGSTLLQRTPRGSRLTGSGTVLVEWAAKLLDHAHELDNAIASLRDDQAGQIRVAASMTIAEHLLPRWLVMLRQSSTPPTVNLTATNSEQVAEAVRAGTASVGFVEGPSAPKGLRSRAVGSDELVLVAAPGHPWSRRRSPITPEEIARTPLSARESGSGTRQVLDDALAGHGLEPAEPAVVLTTSTAVREAVRAGSAPAILSRYAVEADLFSGRLVEVPQSGLDLTRTLRAVWTGSSTPPAGPVRDLLAIATRT